MGALRILNDLELVKSAREGITKKKLEDMIKITGMTQHEFGKYINFTPRAIYRFCYDQRLFDQGGNKVR